MKKISSIILSLCSLILISGCMKHDISMEIKDDKSMNLEIIYAIDKDAIEGMMGDLSNSMTPDSTTDSDKESDDSNLDSDIKSSEDITTSDTDDTSATVEDDIDISYEQDDMSSDMSSMGDMSSMTDTEETEEILKKRGYKVEEYSKDSFTGIKATLEIDNIDNVSVEDELEVILSDILEEDFDDSKFFTVKKGLFSDTYTANFVYKVDENSETDYSSYLSGVEFTYNVTLPSKSISNNSDSEKDNKLTWNIKLDKETKIEYSFEMPNKTNKMIVIGVGAGILLLIIIIIICVAVSSGKKKKKNTGSSLADNNQNITNQYTSNISSNNITEPVQPVNKCRFCNSDITDSQQFCINCGSKLK